MRNRRRRIIFGACALFGLLDTPQAAIRNAVTGFGADNTGASYASEKIQLAINACVPGDTLLIPDGVYLLDDGLVLKSDLTVILAKGALVKANTINVWRRNGSPLFLFNNSRNVLITGGGAIDGGGLVYPRGTYDLPRPGNGIRVSNSTGIAIRGVFVRNIPGFAVDIRVSSQIAIESVTIRGRGFFNLKGSSDGLDIEDNHHVTVMDCDIEVGDDALCLKANDAAHSVHDIVMRRNTLASTCNAWKIGTATVGEVYDILAEDIIVNKHSNPGAGNPVPSGDCIAAIAIESNDQNRVHHVTCRNFTINSCYAPIYLAMQRRGEGEFARMDHILIENVKCLKSVAQPILFNWQCGGPNKMEEIILRNISVGNQGTMGGGTPSCMNGSYPDANKNGIADAYGLWARGVDGLKLECLDLRDDGGSRRRKAVFDASVTDVDSSRISDCSGVGLARKPSRKPAMEMNLTREAFDAWGRAVERNKGGAQAPGKFYTR